LSAAESNPIIIDQTPPALRDVVPRLWTAAFSHDGKTLAVTAGWNNPPEPGELVLWDMATRKPTLIWHQESTIRSTAFSGDGKKVELPETTEVSQYFYNYMTISS
jgi:hypothetical protein